jgi:hypothetical protein
MTLGKASLDVAPSSYLELVIRLLRESIYDFFLRAVLCWYLHPRIGILGLLTSISLEANLPRGLNR